jgi:signal transduction histidine kinase
MLEAGHAERRRIERDLHDSAQQRLVALRIHLTLAGERLDRPEDRTMLARLGVEVDDAIDELRTVASSVCPPNNRVGAGLTPAPPTPPDMRVRIRRFASRPGNGGSDRGIR